MQSIDAALTDIKNGLEALAWKPVVQFENLEAGARGTYITVQLEQVRHEYDLNTISTSKYSYSFTVDVKGTTHRCKDLQDRLRDIDAVLIGPAGCNRRRGGAAQTTISSGWRVVVQDRDGSIITGTVEVHINVN